jgi:HSP20 family protein
MRLELLEKDGIWKELDRFQEEWSNSFFRTGGGSNRAPFPAVNIYQSEEGAELVALVSGYSANDLDISIFENTVRLKGNTPTQKETEGLHLEKREIVRNEFTRTFELNFRIDASKIEANYKNGVLRVKLPKVEEDKPKKISIQIN